MTSKKTKQGHRCQANQNPFKYINDKLAESMPSVRKCLSNAEVFFFFMYIVHSRHQWSRISTTNTKSFAFYLQKAITLIRFTKLLFICDQLVLSTSTANLLNPIFTKIVCVDISQEKCAPDMWVGIVFCNLICFWLVSRESFVKDLLVSFSGVWE